MTDIGVLNYGEYGFPKLSEEGSKKDFSDATEDGSHIGCDAHVNVEQEDLANISESQPIGMVESYEKRLELTHNN